MNYIILSPQKKKNWSGESGRRTEKESANKRQLGRKKQAKQKANVMCILLYTFRTNDNKNFVTICCNNRLYIVLYTHI